VPNSLHGALGAPPAHVSHHLRQLEKASFIKPDAAKQRSLGGCDHPDCVVSLCWTHHRAYDTGRLELLPHLEPQWRDEIAHAVSHLGLIGAVRRLAPGRR